MPDRISVIVPIFNRCDMLRRLLESFDNLACGCPLEFIIVDDCSDEPVRDVVGNWKRAGGYADVHYIRLDTRSGPARARNAGIRHSTGNILAFTDSDCVVDPRWVEMLYRCLTSSPDYAGAGGRVLPLNNDIYSAYNTVYRVLEPPPHLNAVIGANCMFRKQPVADAGMFDEFFSEPGGEEIALCMKLWVKGFRFGFEEGAVVRHDYRNSFRAFVRTFYHYGMGERITILHRLDEYLRYMTYPEIIYHHLAFRNRALFCMIFSVHIVIGSLRQYTPLGSAGLPAKRRLAFVGLYFLQQFCYHLGRGTFSGTFVREIKKTGAKTPDDLRHAEGS